MNEQYAQLLELAEDVDELILFRRREYGSWRHVGGLLRFLRRLRHQRFDWVFDFQGLFRSGFFTWLVPATRKFGFADAREGAPFFYRQRIRVPDRCRHAVERNLVLTAAALGEPWQPETPRFRAAPTAEAAAEKLLRDNGLDGMPRRIAVAPASRWPSKIWPHGCFAAAIRQAAGALGDTAGFWLLGTADERDVGARVAAACSGLRVVNLMGETDLATVLELLRRSDALLTNDSGPMHLAAALGVPTVAIFGPTDATLTGPYGPQHQVLHAKLPCAPCYRRDCPKQPPQTCLRDAIAPESAAEALLRVVAGRPQPTATDLEESP